MRKVDTIQRFVVFSKVIRFSAIGLCRVRK